MQIGGAGEKSLEGFDPKQAGARVIQRTEVGIDTPSFLDAHRDSGGPGRRVKLGRALRTFWENLNMD